MLNFYYLLVLPKFSIKVTVPPYILNSDDLININITARYERQFGFVTLFIIINLHCYYCLLAFTCVLARFPLRYTYGKPVLGTAVVYLSIAGRDGRIVPFARHNIMVSFFVLMSRQY